MLFLDLPDMQARMIETQSAYVVAAASSRSGHVGNFGFCVMATDSAGGVVDITWPFNNLIPRRILNALEDSGRLGVSVLKPADESWLAKWHESFTVKVLRQPEHGVCDCDGSRSSVGYTLRGHNLRFCDQLKPDVC